MLSQTIPCRFHRQRREVLFSRWNKDLKKTETRAVPWEEVCVMGVKACQSTQTPCHILKEPMSWSEGIGQFTAVAK
ncbi:hypothetical protein [Vibrio sp. C8]